jgi:hypothetical protein
LRYAQKAFADLLQICINPPLQAGDAGVCARHESMAFVGRASADGRGCRVHGSGVHAFPGAGIDRKGLT